MVELGNDLGRGWVVLQTSPMPVGGVPCDKSIGTSMDSESIGVIVKVASFMVGKRSVDCPGNSKLMWLGIFVDESKCDYLVTQTMRETLDKTLNN